MSRKKALRNVPYRIPNTIPLPSEPARAYPAVSQSMKYYNKDGVVQQNTTNGWARGIGNFNNNQGDSWRMIALSAGAHTHSVTTTANTTGAASGSTANNSASGASESHSHSITLTSTSSTSTGSGTAFSTMMPYRVVNIWERTA